MTDIERIMSKTFCINCKRNEWMEDEVTQESIILKRDADRITYYCKFCKIYWFRIKMGQPDYYIDPTERRYA
jgi:hypothetical protein